MLSFCKVEYGQARLWFCRAELGYVPLSTSKAKQWQAPLGHCGVMHGQSCVELRIGGVWLCVGKVRPCIGQVELCVGRAEQSGAVRRRSKARWSGA